MKSADPSRKPAAALAPATFVPPLPSLAGCVRAVASRNTLNLDLKEDDRHNNFSANLMCRLTWFFSGAWDLKEGAELTPMGPVVFSGPQTRPTITVNRGHVDLLSVAFYPDAFQQMTGVFPGDFVDRNLSVEQVLPKEWAEWALWVHQAGPPGHPVELLHGFIQARWDANRDPSVTIGPLFQDWLMHLSNKAAFEERERGPRQMERLVKRWTGQNLRGLRSLARNEQAFSRTNSGIVHRALSWKDVALQSGYTDQSHFCRDTRKITGFTPEQIRRDILKKESFWMYRLWANSFAVAPNT
jgi:AraC-like DNA-binding protein